MIKTIKRWFYNLTHRYCAQCTYEEKVRWALHVHVIAPLLSVELEKASYPQCLMFVMTFPGLHPDHLSKVTNILYMRTGRRDKSLESLREPLTKGIVDFNKAVERIDHETERY